MYELECLRRRMEDKVAAAAAKEVELEELNLDLASAIFIDFPFRGQPESHAISIWATSRLNR